MHRHQLLLGLLGVVGCSSKASAPEKEREKPPTHEPAPKKNKLERITTTAPLEITNIEVLPLGTMAGPSPGQYSTSYVATRDGQKAPIEAHMRCRVEGYNLVSIHSSSSSNRQDTAFWGDPFGTPASVCEIRWYEMVDKRESVVARACFHDAVLTDGECPRSAFPMPKLADGFAIDFKPVPSPKRFENPIPPMQMSQTNVQFSAIVTLGKALGDKVAGYKLRCQEGRKVGVFEDTNEFVNLWRMEPGESVYAWEFVFHGDDTLQSMTAPDRCELEILAVARDAAKMKGELLGRFCIAKNGDTTPGACTPPIGT